MSEWAILYGGACSERGIAPREELKDAGEDLVVIKLNGNCRERFSNRVTDLEAGAIAQAVAQSSHVTDLDLSYNNLTDEGARQMAGMLKQNTSVQHLNLSYNAIGHKGWRTIASTMPENKTLLSLSVAGNDISGESNQSKPELREIGGKTIGAMLRENRTLESLNISSCGLGVCALVGIAQALIGHPSMTSLNISNPHLKSIQERLTVAQHLSELLKKNNVLQELNLSRSMLNDEQFKMMLSAYVFNDSLQSVLLASNKLSQDGGAEVAKLLSRRHDLVVIDLSSNNISTTGAEAIAGSLKHNQGITTLNLSFCGIGEDGLIAICMGLKANHSISSLSLWGNTWTDKAAKAFYANKTRLEELIFFDCEFQVVDGVPQVTLAEGGGMRSA